MKVKPIADSVFVFWILFLLASFFMAGCQAKDIQPQPPEIAYGRDQCDQCGMMISEERFASGLQLADGKYFKFDDTGEMIKYFTNHQDTNVLAWWVHDYDSLDWIRGEEAFFVMSTTLQTPMGTGILAFQARESADKFAAENNGTVYSLDEIRSQVQMTDSSH